MTEINWVSIPPLKDPCFKCRGKKGDYDCGDCFGEGSIHRVADRLFMKDPPRGVRFTGQTRFEEVEWFLTPDPTAWKCNKCGFVLQRRFINTATGQVGGDTSDVGWEPCPNDGTRLVRDDSLRVQYIELPGKDEPWERAILEGIDDRIIDLT